MIIEFKKTELAKKIEASEKGKTLSFTPRKATPKSAGYDLAFCIDKVLPLQPGEIALIGTGICIHIGSSEAYPPHDSLPFKAAGVISPRSGTTGLSLENTIGLIDQDYQGELKLRIRNTSKGVIKLEPGQKKFQIFFIPVYSVEFKKVSEFLNQTSRGSGGFGSTGE